MPAWLIVVVTLSAMVVFYALWLWVNISASRLPRRSSASEAERELSWLYDNCTIVHYDGQGVLSTNPSEGTIDRQVFRALIRGKWSEAGSGGGGVLR